MTTNKRLHAIATELRKCLGREASLADIYACANLIFKAFGAETPRTKKAPKPCILNETEIHEILEENSWTLYFQESMTSWEDENPLFDFSHYIQSQF